MNIKVRKAIKESIVHWEKDILEPLLLGEKCVDKHYGENCPLCKLIKPKISIDCRKCPLRNCEHQNSLWHKYSSACLDNKKTFQIKFAKLMIKKLKGLLK